VPAVLAVPLLNRPVPMFRVLRTERGFSLTELMMTVAVAATIMGMAVPVMTDVSATIKLNEAARMVERELQDARLKAVQTNRPLRVRTNCPGLGFIRTFEVLGTAADALASRCLTNSIYPFPSDPDNDLSTSPNYDGPVRVVPNAATVTTVNLQFQPDGTVFTVAGPSVNRMATEQTMTITRAGRSRTVRINGAGKIQIQ
jgi:prepilin-type N-terminal cleavage/methylation domain-containing protein